MKNNDPVISLRITKKMKDQIDKIIEKGYYVNQSDFIRTAIRRMLRFKNDYDL